MRHAIVGTWKKISGDRGSQVYPEMLEFLLNGVYKGSGIADAIPDWEHGVWELIGDRQIAMSVSSDRVRRYGFIVKGDRLSFVSPEGCRFSYQRLDARHTS